MKKYINEINEIISRSFFETLGKQISLYNYNLVELKKLYEEYVKFELNSNLGKLEILVPKFLFKTNKEDINLINNQEKFINYIEKNLEINNKNKIIKFNLEEIEEIEEIKELKENTILLKLNNYDYDIFLKVDTKLENNLNKLMKEDKLNLIDDIEIELKVELGRKKMLLSDIIKYDIGSIIELNKNPNETLNILANNKKIAEGEVVIVDGQLGIQLTKIL